MTNPNILIDNVMQEMKQIEKQLLQDNRKLQALRLVAKEYATEDYPGTQKLNTIITEYLNKHGGRAPFQKIVECVDDHQITISRAKLSLLLTKHPGLKYDRDNGKWTITTELPLDQRI